MGGGHRSRSAPRGPQVLSGLTLLTLLLLLLVVQINSQEVPEWISFIREIKENMEKINERFATIENSLMEMKRKGGEEHLDHKSCPDYFIPINITGECILIAQSYSTYKEATENCASIGAHLAIPKDVGILGAFLFERESSLSHVRFWIGADNNFSPHLWRWVDGKPVDAVTLHYSSEAASMTYVDQSENLRGILYLGQHRYESGYNGTGYKKLLSTPFDESGRYPYLCEIEPGSETLDIEFPLDSACPEEYSPILSYECIYLSSVEEARDHHKALSFCEEQKTTLFWPSWGWSLSPLLTNFFTKQNYDGEYVIWVDDNAMRVEGDDEWRREEYDYNNTWYDNTGLCPLFRTSPPYTEFYKEMVSCSSRQNFICSIKIDIMFENNFMDNFPISDYEHLI